MYKPLEIPEFGSAAMLIENSPIPFAVLDSEFRVIYANPVLLERLPKVYDPFFLYEIFGNLDSATIKNNLISQKRYDIVVDLPDQKGAEIVFNPIYSFEKKDKIIGETACIVSSNSGETKNNSNYMEAVNRELRDRITIMFTSLYAISNDKQFEPSNKICDYINNINQNCFQLLRVSDNLSKLFRLTAGDEHINPKLINLVEYIKKIIDTVILFDNKNSVPIKFVCDCKFIPVNIDLTQMEFVFSNILLNSIKYTREGNEITVTLKATEDNAIVSVEDRGVGIPADVLKNIGEPYFSYSHNDKFEAGFGIGLCVSKKYTASNKGAFLITSKQGVGTTVSVSIPIDKLPSPDDPESKILVFNSPPRFEPDSKFSQTRIQLSEVCFYPTI